MQKLYSQMRELKKRLLLLQSSGSSPITQAPGRFVSLQAFKHSTLNPSSLQSHLTPLSTDVFVQFVPIGKFMCMK